jgi:hypothetical protein
MGVQKLVERRIKLVRGRNLEEETHLLEERRTLEHGRRKVSEGAHLCGVFARGGAH